MSTDQKILAQILRQIAYDAGCVLLGHADSETAKRCVTRYNHVCARIRRRHTALAPVCPCLPDTAPASRVRMAARDAAAHVEDAIASCYFAKLAA